MVGRLLVGFVWLNLQFSVSWLVDFQWGSCGSIFSFLCLGWQTFSGVPVAQSLVLCHGRYIFSGVRVAQSLVLCHDWYIFSGVRVAQSLVFCVMVGRLLVGFVWLFLQFSVSWFVDFQWGSCGSIFSFLCHGWQTFSGVRVAQSLVFCVMVGKFLVEFVWLNLQFSVSWLVDFQWGSCGSIFSFLYHGWQTFSGVRVAQSLVLCNGWYIFSGVRVAQSLVLCVMVGIFLVGFVQLFLCHDRQTFSGIRAAQCLIFYLMVGKLLVGFVWLNLQFSVSWLVDFQCGSCGSIFSFLCHGRQTFSGARVAQSLVFCVMVGRLLVGFVQLNLQFCVMVGIFLVGFVWFNLYFSVS